VTSHPSGRIASLRDAVFITAATYITTGLGLVVSMIAARDLGPEAYGKYAYLVWMSGILVLCCNHGLGLAGIRFVSEYIGRNERKTAEQIHHWLGRWQVISTAAVLALFFVAVWWMPLAGWESQRPLLAGIVVIGVAAKASYLFDVSIAKGHKLFQVEALTNSLMSMVYVAGVGALALSHASLNAYAIYFGAVSAAHIVLVRKLMKRHDIHADPTPCPPGVIERLRPHIGWTVVLVAAAILSNKTLETFILGTRIGPAEVGYFTIAATLTKGGIDVLSSALTAMLMPMMAHAFGEGGMARVNEILKDAVRHFLFFGLVIAGVGLLWAEQGVSLLYGHRYDAVIPALQVMVIVGGLTLPEGALGALLSTTDHQKLRAGIVAMSLVISATSAIVLVSHYGLNGALWSVAVTRFLILFVTAATIHKLLGARFPVNEIVRQLAAAAIAGALCAGMLYLSNGPLMQVLSGFVYLLAFLASTVWLKAWTRQDAELALALAERRPALQLRLAPWLRKWAQTLP
jgi:O-antigen/teichoic acid export membrane protein